MHDKTNNHSMADRSVNAEHIPPQRAPSSRPRSSCLAGFGCLLVMMILAAVLLGVWIWQLNRNPDPFPWTPERQWTLPARPLDLDFVDSDGSLIVLCDDGKAPVSALAATSIMRCDFETGTILSSHHLPFPASAFAASPNTDSVLVAGIVPSPDDSYISIGLPDGAIPRPHLLRLAVMRLPDWSVDAEYEEELEASSFASSLAAFLRVEPVPAQKAWAVGIGDPKQETYRVSLHEQETLAKMDSRTFSKVISPGPICLTVDRGDPSTILVGRPVESFTYRWDAWSIDSGNVTTEDLRGDHLDLMGAIRGDDRLSDCYLAGPIYKIEDRVAGISPKGLFHADVFNSGVRLVLPVPIHRDNAYETSLTIWRSTRGKPIASGMFQGHAHAIMTLRFSPDNEFLVTGHQGGDIRLWRLPSGGQ
ncbi:MAG: hypothetical protein ACOX1P_22525 [Thermoguttaceae bacterium]|jgi:hypothetical protein